MHNVLLDTDVILDFFFDREPYSGYSARIFSLCELKRIKGFITPVICTNVYYLLRQTARHEKVIGKLSLLMNLVDVLPIDRNVLLQALSSGFKDFKDAVQNFAAVRSGHIDVIITSNVKDYIKSDIGVLTPESYLKSLT
jgi:predicted nucleic acid-binding protein